MTTDGDPVDVASALEQLWGARRGAAPAPAPPPRGPETDAAVADVPPSVSPPQLVVDAAVDERVAELRADIHVLRTELLTALDKHESRLRDDLEGVARHLAEAQPTAEPDVHVAERIDGVAAQVTGLAERFTGLERLVESAMARRAEPETNSDSASARLEAAMDGFDAVVAGLDAAVAGLASGVTERLAGVAADVVRDASVAPLRRELRGAKADIAAVRKAVAELQADLSSLRAVATLPAAKPAPAVPVKKRAAPPPKRAAAPAKKTAPRSPAHREPAAGDEAEAFEPPVRTSGARRTFRGELATWEEDESVGEDRSGRATDEAAVRDRRRQILAEAARSAAEGGDLDLDDLFTVTEPGPQSANPDAGDRASKPSRFGSRRDRT